MCCIIRVNEPCVGWFIAATTTAAGAPGATGWSGASTAAGAAAPPPTTGARGVTRAETGAHPTDAPATRDPAPGLIHPVSLTPRTDLSQTNCLPNKQW